MTYFTKKKKKHFGTFCLFLIASGSCLAALVTRILFSQ